MSEACRSPASPTMKGEIEDAFVSKSDTIPQKNFAGLGLFESDRS
jgi:hypothetical protein